MALIKTAIFGSAFNPPHCGHLDVIEQALAEFDQVVVVPSFQHAFGKTMAPFNVRLEMANALIKGMSSVSVSDIESSIALQKPGEPIYTYDVLCALEALHPNWVMQFVVGPDNANPEVWQKFYQHKAIGERWGRWPAKERKHIRSTAIREALSRGEVIHSGTCPTDVTAIYTRYLKARDDD